MRYGACTEADIAYLESRTVSKRPGHPNFKDPRFRNISVITGLNSQKDKINLLGCHKFAEETGQELVHFYSDDVLCAGSDDRRPKSTKKRKAVKVTHQIPKGVQEQLWEAWPCSTSEHVPGKLSLCIGLPVMLRNNDATELCITKGQEAIVVGWNEALGHQDQRILDTLFVELVKPPKEVRIPGLPPNVVALTRATKKIWCALKDDRVIQISREQVLILPNFAMTDYASQGKSRDFNVVDLNNCRTHFAYYTALSRSTSSDGTVILQGIATGKITRGISGFLRQEFRELELLNEISRLRYHNRLPGSVKGINRRELLRAYQEYKGGNYQPDDLHHAVRWKSNEDPPLMPLNLPVGKWELVGSDKPKPKDSKKSQNKEESNEKRKRSDKSADEPKGKKQNTTRLSVPGLKWDQSDFSCAYDALFSPLYTIWEEHGPRWSELFGETGYYLHELAKGFKSFRSGTGKLETARDHVRQQLHTEAPILFPVGQVLTSIDDLALRMFGEQDWGNTVTKCTRCGAEGEPTAAFPGAMTITYSRRLQSKFGAEYSISHWLNDRKMRRTNRTCRCRNGLVSVTKLDAAPPCFYLSLADTNILINSSLSLTVGQDRVRYALRGVVYGADEHFTSRILKANGDLWYHDGIETGSETEYQGSIHTHDPIFLNTSTRGESVKRAVGVIYARIEL
ncbi:hypothetical protein C8R43DRAFT_909494 [Mycena crocata]|nr:hypothetical protein C8R43DRAFT_909494 [Mycena crocata]